MYTSYIGKKFLDMYRSKNGLTKEFTALQFFDEILFPIFFNDRRHLMHVHGSSFFQPLGKHEKNLINKGESEPKLRLERLHRNIQDGPVSGSTFVSYAAGSITQPTSSQLSSLLIAISPEDIYASWIGEALAIGIAGGILLLEEEEILWSIFEGWGYYRKFLSQNIELKDRQIETWNAHWLTHSFDRYFDPSDPWVRFLDKQRTDYRIDKETNKRTLVIVKMNWIEILFTLARIYPTQVINAFGYELSKMNTTYGFISLILPDIKNLFQLKDTLFSKSISEIWLDEHYEAYFKFSEVCKLGCIGLRALEPSQLRNFMPDKSVPFAKGQDFKVKTETDFFQFQIFKTWIIAMLNSKTELDGLAAKVAQALIAFEHKESRTNVLKQLSADTLNARNQREFIEQLIEIMRKDEGTALVFKEVKDAVLQIPVDTFPLFLTLIRFEYQFQKSIKS
jgi:hypothetical protein